MEFILWVQVSQKSTFCKWASNGIQDVDCDNQQGKDVIGKAVGNEEGAAGGERVRIDLHAA